MLTTRRWGYVNHKEMGGVYDEILAKLGPRILRPAFPPDDALSCTTLTPIQI
jgi:hypothetical protein